MSNFITSPGKFEGEPDYVPLLWDRVMSGFSDISVHDGSMALDGFALDANLAALTGLEPAPGQFLVLWSDDNGFVSHMVMSEEELHQCEGMDPDDEWNVETFDIDPFDGYDVGGEAGF